MNVESELNGTCVTFTVVHRLMIDDFIFDPVPGKLYVGDHRKLG